MVVPYSRATVSASKYVQLEKFITFLQSWSLIDCPPASCDHGSLAAQLDNGHAKMHERKL